MNLICHPEEQGTRHVSAQELNDLQEAAETVAFDHFSRCSCEFVEWFREQDYGIDLAHIVVGLVCGDAADKAEARRLSVRVQDDFTSFVANCESYDRWPLARQLYREVRK